MPPALSRQSRSIQGRSEGRHLGLQFGHPTLGAPPGREARKVARHVQGVVGPLGVTIGLVDQGGVVRDLLWAAGQRNEPVTSGVKSLVDRQHRPLAVKPGKVAVLGVLVPKPPPRRLPPPPPLKVVPTPVDLKAFGPLDPSNAVRVLGEGGPALAAVEEEVGPVESLPALPARKLVAAGTPPRVVPARFQREIGALGEIDGGGDQPRVGPERHKANVAGRRRPRRDQDPVLRGAPKDGAHVGPDKNVRVVGNEGVVPRDPKGVEPDKVLEPAPVHLFGPPHPRRENPGDLVDFDPFGRKLGPLVGRERELRQRVVGDHDDDVRRDLARLGLQLGVGDRPRKPLPGRAAQVVREHKAKLPRWASVPRGAVVHVEARVVVALPKDRQVDLGQPGPR
eukprot:m.29575 g.29575  ORF g.29575 m.29575 type:complete len:394 (-) comp6716_c0_seq1:66-1247(-)